MNQYQQIMEVFSQKDAEIERLEESIGQLALKLDELDGWEPIGEFEKGDSGPSLTEIKSIASNLRKLTSTNPLLKRGCDLRGSYVFGNGITFREVKPAALAVMDDKQNKRTMFSIQGYEELNRAKYTDGNVFIIFNDKTKRFTRVPLGEIESLITNPLQRTKLLGSTTKLLLRLIQPFSLSLLTNRSVGRSVYLTLWLLSFGQRLTLRT